jgi:beta-xylosidase
MTSDPDPIRGADRPWQDRTRPLDDRVALLVERMTVAEKLAQLAGVWMGGANAPADMAPGQREQAGPDQPWDQLVRSGLGHLTRVFGTAPVEPAEAARALAAAQRGIVAGSRLGIPAIAHEECLTGFTAWKATVFPTPLAWGATFDPGCIERMAAAIGRSMRAVGVHQGLAPVVDVTRDPRWGRTEETVGEDPYLVGTIGAAYARGLESVGIVATLKHFAGYAASGAGRNHAPVSMGPRELADVVLAPFEAALREGRARSVMNSYAEVDGVPPAADPALLTGLLRERWGFEGVVVSDYYAVSFLETMHGLAGSPGEAAALALAAGVDVELPSPRCFGAPLLEEVRSGRVPEHLVDRAVARVLRQKGELGLLDTDWDPEPDALRSGRPVDLDPPELRALAAGIAERSVVLLDNPTGALPLSPERIAVLGPCADDVRSLMGCYAFPNHVGDQHPDTPLGIAVPTVLDALRAEFPTAMISYAPGCPVQEPDASGIPAAVAAARDAGLCVVAVGDRAGLFGRGTSGEGCDVEELRLPGSQHELLDAVLGAGVPVVLVVLSGRPYALGAYVGRAAGIVQAFFPGQQGAAAVAGVLSGRVNPSGRLPVQVPLRPGGQPTGYLRRRLGGRTSASSIDPTPLFPFGHGLSYTSFRYEELAVSRAELPVDGEVEVSCLVTNTGERAGAEVVQLYLHDPVASVTRPERQLLGFARVELEAGQQARVVFRLHADRTSCTGRDLQRVVEPGDLDLLVGPSSEQLPLQARVTVTGARRRVGSGRVLLTPARVETAVPATPG